MEATPQVPWVRLVDSLGNDARVVNAARVSYGKAIDSASFCEGDARLLHYLAKHRHMSPFRHCTLTFHLRQPEFVARQAYKHAVGIAATSDGGATVDAAWNEISGRYVEFQATDFWRGPIEWRGTPAKGQSKQGSRTGAIPECDQTQAQQIYEQSCADAYRSYQALLHIGVAREQARCVLPLSFMTEWYWTLSLEAAVHFCALRRAADAQSEIRDVARDMEVAIQALFPVSYEALLLAAPR